MRRSRTAPDLLASHQRNLLGIALHATVKEPVDNVPVEIDAQTEITSANAPTRSDRFSKTQTEAYTSS